MEKKINVDLIFNDLAKEYFRFPIRNPIRISFWTKASVHSSPCEITFEDEKVDVKEKVRADIIVIDIDIKENDTFFLGVFPHIIGEGVVLK